MIIGANTTARTAVNAINALNEVRRWTNPNCR